MDKITYTKNQICKLRKAWEATPDEIDGFKDAEAIDSDVQDVIISYCEEKKYNVDGFTVEKLKALSEEGDLFPYKKWEQFVERLALLHEDIVELLWFYHHTLWPNDDLWQDRESLVKYLKDDLTKI